jgi:outer membrane protein assembly factor BamA
MPLRRALAALLLFAPLAAHAQYSVAAVVFENPAPYTDAELLAVSGLQTGQMLVHDSLANAGQHLLDTGLFANVEVSLSGDGKARTVHVALQPTPLAGLLPVSFQNLVWFTPDELTQGIHAHVPLYRGAAPEAGNLQDAIQTALQQMFTDKGVTAKLTYEVVAATAQHPVRVVNYRVTDPSVRLVDVHLSVAAPTEVTNQLVPGLQKAVNRATHVPFNEGLTGQTIEDLLLAAARNFGYVTAKLDHISRTVAPADHSVAVTYAARVVPGDAYKVSSFTWTPTPIYTSSDFTRDAKLHAGDLANLYALNETDAAITAAYLAKGYMDVIVVAPPVLDEAAHTVAYAPQVIPGEVYHLKTVTALNLSPEAKTEFDRGWLMKPGDPYSEAYVSGFIQANTALQHLAKYAATFQASADPQTHLVDLTITFTPNSH